MQQIKDREISSDSAPSENWSPIDGTRSMGNRGREKKKRKRGEKEEGENSKPWAREKDQDNCGLSPPQAEMIYLPNKMVNKAMKRLQNLHSKTELPFNLGIKI